MCRLAAFPPNFPRQEAIDILRSFAAYNEDGVGYVFSNHNKFNVVKSPKSFTKVLRRNHNFLEHMPYDGWTVAHLRAASHGVNVEENTHPFVAGAWAVVHNGIWSEYSAVKLALENRVKFKGETDSEVAAYLLAIAGPKKFAATIDGGGVFLALHRSGNLHVAKTSGDLSFFPWKEKILLASELPMLKYREAKEAQLGWFMFNSGGQLVKRKNRIPSYFVHSRQYLPSHFNHVYDEDDMTFDDIMKMEAEAEVIVPSNNQQLYDHKRWLPSGGGGFYYNGCD